MAKELEQFPENAGRGRPDKYPWETWFNGKPWQLDAGEDFDATLKPESFRATARSAAQKRGGKLKAAVINDGKSLVIQFFPGT